jgi:hypothetical protein
VNINGISVCGFALSTLLVSCATTPVIIENPVAAELAPMEKPVVVARRVYQMDLLTGVEESIDYGDSQSDGSYMAIKSNGCTWTNDGDLVAPATSWGNCGGSGQWGSGKNINMEKKGVLWPLAVGNKISYSYNQVDAYGDKKSKTKMTCKVSGTANIEVAAGNLDVYKVECLRRKDTWSQSRVFYFSPELQEEVKFVSRTSDEGINRNVELTRVEPL